MGRHRNPRRQASALSKSPADRRAASAATVQCRTNYKAARPARAVQTRDTRQGKPAAPKSRSNAWFADDAPCRTFPTRPIAPRKQAAPPSDTRETADRAGIVRGEKSSLAL